MQTLIITFWRDVFKFLGMFFVILVILGGSMYFSIRYDADLDNSTTTILLPGDGRLDIMQQFIDTLYLTKDLLRHLYPEH